MAEETQTPDYAALADEPHQFADLWAVHAERNGEPWMVDWAKSEDEAKKKMAAAKADAADEEGAADTGGHGKVFVMELLDVMKLWNGERGPKAL